MKTSQGGGRQKNGDERKPAAKGDEKGFLSIVSVGRKRKGSKKKHKRQRKKTAARGGRACEKKKAMEARGREGTQVFAKGGGVHQGTAMVGNEL